jgi:UDP-perosamine 4-acetyltransferase
MSLPVIVIGGGGHAKVLINTLLDLSVIILGFTDCDAANIDLTILGIRALGNDDVILKYPSNSIQLVNGLGSVNSTQKRKKIFEFFKKQDYNFASVVHPASIISRDVVLSEGAQVLAGTIIQPGCRIGRNTIINTKVSVDHDCLIGDHVHLAPGTTLSGMVSVGSDAHIGTGTTVIQGINIGQNSLIGAGALLLKDVPAGTTAIGVPAKVLYNRAPEKD